MTPDDRDERYPPPDELEEVEDPNEVTVRIALPRAGQVMRREIPTLRVIAGRDMLKFVPIASEGEIVIGRDESSALQLTDVTVSKRHARIVCDARGVITAIDLESTNGTAVNGRAITRAVLRAGDQLELGGVSLRLDLLSLDELRHLNRVLQRLESANRDPLTGLLTRAYIEDGLSHLAEQCARSGIPFSCAFVDVDRFKTVNDNYGHQVGDEVLCSIARLLMVGVRDADPCVRYGGEEIMLFLTGTDEDRAHEVADRIRKSIAGHDWARHAPGLRVTASFGIAQREPAESLKDWIARSDRAVYEAKRLGRNRVFRASDMDS